jgi:hypothetical protein
MLVSIVLKVFAEAFKVKEVKGGVVCDRISHSKAPKGKGKNRKFVFLYI